MQLFVYKDWSVVRPALMTGNKKGGEHLWGGNFIVGHHQHSSMAAVVPFASCYAGSQPLQLFGRGPAGANYLSLLAYRGPRCAPRPRLTCHAPKMTLRQICRMLKMMKQGKKRENAAAARKQGSASPAPSSPGSKAERKCPPCCLRHKRSIKRIS